MDAKGRISESGGGDQGKAMNLEACPCSFDLARTVSAFTHNMLTSASSLESWVGSKGTTNKAVDPGSSTGIN